MNKLNSEQCNDEGQQYDLNHLIYLMERLRDAKDGCPWDIDQNYQSIAPSTIEEAYEVVDAIERGNLSDLKEELGDLLFQVVFHSQLAAEESAFNLESVIHTLVTKLIRRHPHVFPGGQLQNRKGLREPLDTEQTPNVDVKRQWEDLKEQERKKKGLSGVLDDVPLNLPALTRAQKLQKRAARVGFDWHSIEPVFEKVQEELTEVKEAIHVGESSAIEDEVGDLLFTCVNLARHLKVDAETALRKSGKKFTDRFIGVQTRHQKESPDVPFDSLSPEQMNALWEREKISRESK